MNNSFKYYLVNCKKCLKETKIKPEEFRKKDKKQIICENCLDKILKSFKKI